MILRLIFIKLLLVITLNANTLKCNIDGKKQNITIEFFEEYIKINNKYKAFSRGIYSGNKHFLKGTNIYKNKGYTYYILNNGNGSYYLYIDSSYEGFQYGECYY